MSAADSNGHSRAPIWGIVIDMEDLRLTLTGTAAVRFGA